VSGTWPGGETVGSGPEISDVRAIDKGADGMLYAWAESAVHMRIFRVDPDTGDRELIWTDYDATQVDTNDPESGQCPNDNTGPGTQFVQASENGFAVEPSGDFLIPVIPSSAGVNQTGGGIIRISADGDECSWMTRWPNNDADTASVGSGPTDPNNFTVLDYRDGGVVWGLSFDGNFMQMDPITGDRELITQIRAGVGTYSISVDHDREIIYFGGTDAPGTYVSALDVPNVREIPVTCADVAPYPDEYGCLADQLNGPFARTGQHLQPTWYDPGTDRLILANDNSTFFWGETLTGATMIMSM
jgi:hypothetical protein